MQRPPLQILFLCTGNSARSILGEGILGALSQGRIQTHSAGSHPTGLVHPMALYTLKRLFPEAGFGALRSKSMTEWQSPMAPALDAVITVCDSAAQEPCPYWPGAPLVVHWGFADPSAQVGPLQEKAFSEVAQVLKKRSESLLQEPLETMTPAELKSCLMRLKEVW